MTQKKANTDFQTAAGAESSYDWLRDVRSGSNIQNLEKNDLDRYFNRNGTLKQPEIEAIANTKNYVTLRNIIVFLEERASARPAEKTGIRIKTLAGFLKKIYNRKINELTEQGEQNYSNLLMKCE